MSVKHEADNVVRLPVAPRIIPRAEHTVSRSRISDYALKVMYRLRAAGYQAYLVGGGVRDLLLEREPKDFDVATDARPEQVRELFRNCRLIGRRFRLAHVHFGEEIIEVATFRAQYVEDDEDADRVVEDGRILRDNVYGSLDDDVWRRDFTVNALYYNIEDFSIVDYVGAMDDIHNRQLRLIGDPEARFREDPVRMLRAARFAAKLGFTLHPATEAPIERLAPLLDDIPPARLFDEVLKLFLSGHALQSLAWLRRYRLFHRLFPYVSRTLDAHPEGSAERLLIAALENTDARVREGKSVTPAFLFASLLWPQLEPEWHHALESGLDEMGALSLAADNVISQQVARVAIPRRFTQLTREIWLMQPRFAQRVGRRPERLLALPRFRAGYDFLALRATAGDADPALAQWWEVYQTADPDARTALQLAPGEGERGGGSASRRRRRPRRRRKPE
jgi:poly(A) polymerase